MSDVARANFSELSTIFSKNVLEGVKSCGFTLTKWWN